MTITISGARLITMSIQQPVLSASEEQTRELLLSMPFFDAFSNDEIDILARHMNFGDIRSGEYLFFEGDRDDYMCFVVHGLLDVLKKSENGEYQVIARLTKGSTIGEMSIVDKSSRSAAVIARQPSRIIMLTRKGFNRLTSRYPALGIVLLKKIMRQLSLNMRRTSSRLADVAGKRSFS